MKLVSRSHLPKDSTNATMHMQCEKKTTSASLISLRGGRCLPLMVQMQYMEKGKRKRNTKLSGIFSSGPSLAYAEREKKKKERKMQETPRPPS